jgi:Tfp pilus assembly protein PilF
MEKKDFIDAKEAFLMAVKLDPKKASRHYNLATAYDELREYRNAQESLEEALKLDKDNKKYLKYLDELKQKIDYRYEQMKRKED